MATTALKTSSVLREFVFNGSRIPDPDSGMSIDQVRDLLTPSYPEIATATMTGRRTQERACVTPSPEPSVRKGKSHAPV